MTTLGEQIATAMKESMRAKDTLTLDTVRMAKTALKNKEIELIRPLIEAEEFAVLQSLVKQREEAATQYRNGGRAELAKKEESEIVVLGRFLPAALSPAELEALIQDVVRELAAKDMKQMGAVIKGVMAKAAGRADGSRVSAAVKQILSAL